MRNFVIMNPELMIQRWIEYSMCEYAIMAFKQSNSKSSNVQSFCERLRESLIRGNMSRWERKTFYWILEKANKAYCLPDDEIDAIAVGFFVERRWERYMKAIALMKNVKYYI
jgi:hypothetical protein